VIPTACRPNRWILGFLALVFLGFTLPAIHATGTDLRGVVRGHDGQAVGGASVFIYTAGPRQGVGIYCPSCYLDCRKSTRSATNGEFKIEALDPDLVFEILVVAPGHVPAFFKRIDPAAGRLEATIEPRSAAEIPATQTIAGRVLNARGEPVVGAVVSVEGTTIGNTTQGRPPRGTDPLAVTDEKGAFAIRSAVPFDSMGLVAEARAYAKRAVAEARPGLGPVEIVLSEGAALGGRVTRDGRPVPGVAVGVAQSDRTVGSGFTGNYTIATQADGSFLLVNLPPDCEYDFYGVMATLQAHGAIPDRKIRLKSDGTNFDLGEVKIVPGHRLAGQVKLSDDAELPAHTQLMVGRKDAWDSLLLDLPAHGRFDFANVPEESISLNLRVPGYRLSARNASFNPINPSQLAGRLQADTTNLTVLFEPGAGVQPDLTSIPPEAERPENLPLGGSETTRTIPNGITFFGRVFDAATGSPLPRFRVTPGYVREPRMKDWIQWGRAIEGTNGEFSVLTAPGRGTVVLRAEAEGHLPSQSSPLDAKHATWEFRLLAGTGPKGIVVRGDGRPVESVAMVLLGAREQARIDASGNLSMARSADLAKTTGPDGGFAFAPKLGPTDIVAAGVDGFACVPAAEFAKTGRLMVRSWARIRGRLLMGGKPVAGEHLDLGTVKPLSAPWSHLNLAGTVTDADGRFAMEFVPPIELNLNTRAAVEGVPTAWAPVSQKKFTPEPGADLDLGDLERSDSRKTAGFGQ